MTLPVEFGPLLRVPKRSGVLSDFDGTLAPIVGDPALSRPLDGVADVLGRLAARMGRVAVISGRPAQFLLEHLGGRGISIWGLYGLERVERDRVVPIPEAEDWVLAVRDAAARAARELNGRLHVEDKGLALTVHYRATPELAEFAREWTHETSERTGLEMHPGRMSYELRPPVNHGKGTALEEAVDGLGAACFFGDDHGDLDAFDALDRLAAAGMAAVRVGVTSAESPPELLERADLTVDGPEGVLGLLTGLQDGVSA